MFSREYYKMFKNTYFEEHLRAAASEPNSKFNMNKVGFVILHIYEKHKFSHKKYNWKKRISFKRIHNHESSAWKITLFNFSCCIFLADWVEAIRVHLKSTSLTEWYFWSPSRHVTRCHFFSNHPPPCFMRLKVTDYEAKKKKPFFYISLLKHITLHHKRGRGGQILSFQPVGAVTFTYRHIYVNKSCWQNDGIIILWIL